LEKEAASNTLRATSIAHFVNDGSFYVMITLYSRLLPLASQLPLIGILAGILNLLSVVASPIIGRTADRKKNYARLISLGLFMMGLGVAGYSLSHIFASGFTLFLILVPFAVIAGVGSSFYHPLGATILHEKWKSQSLGRAMGINGSMGSAGRAVYPLIVSALVVYFTIPSVTVLAIVAFLSAFLVLKILSQLSFGKSEIGDAAATEQNSSQQQQEHNSSTSPPKRTTVSSILPKIVPLTVLSFLRGFYMFGITSFALSYFQHVSGIVSTLERGAIFSVILGMAIFGQPFLGHIADKYGRRLILGISIIASSAGIFFALSVTNLYLEIFGFAVFGLFGLTGFPLILPLASAAVPKDATALSNSIVWGVGNVGGGALGPVVIGLLAGPALFNSLREPFLIAALMSLVSLALLPLVPKPKPKVKVAAAV
jgi:MFS transporter, FSR family, fosmidomycin resistance protein